MTLTDEQKKKILFHFTAAAVARARQWDHEAEIENILGYEIDDFQIENFATCVDTDPDIDTPDSLFDWEDIKDIIENGD